MCRSVACLRPYEGNNKLASFAIRVNPRSLVFALIRVML